jgi:hypothetical protein
VAADAEAKEAEVATAEAVTDDEAPATEEEKPAE